MESHFLGMTKMPKKVLIITYYWPPAGGPGVQRWLKFVKYLPEFDIHPVVYIPENPSYPIVDESLLYEIPDSTTIISQPIEEPYKLAELFSSKHSKTISYGVIPKERKQNFVQKLMLYVRGNYFIPDARKAWIQPSVNYLLDYIQKENIQTVITTGPPHSLHLVGLKLKEQLNIKWLADFRDPWTTIGYHKQLKLTPSAARKHEELEKMVLQTADSIIVTSENTKSEFKEKTSKPIEVITNGYDTYQLQKPEKDDTFTISHIGSLLSGRNPIVLWEVLRELIQENADFKNYFQLKLIGLVSEDVLNDINSHNLKDHVNLVGYLKHEDALMQQRQSRLLLLVEIDSEDTKAIIPGKLFEYMISETPIIAIGPKESDVERIIQSTNTGSYFYYDDRNKLKSQILMYFEAYKTDSLITNPIGLKPYSRRELTRKLSDLL